jgi:hypothetical protein
MFAHLFGSHGDRRPKRPSFQPVLEVLEDRRMLSASPIQQAMDQASQALAKVARTSDPCTRAGYDYAEAAAGAFVVAAGLLAPAPVPVKAGAVIVGGLLILDGVSRLQKDQSACLQQHLQQQLNQQFSSLFGQVTPTAQPSHDPDNDGDVDMY